MTSAIKSRTPTLGLGLLRFDFPNWGDDANLNMQVLDAAFGTLGLTLSGVWMNSLAITAGQLWVDPDDNSLWRAKITHVSSASGTFKDDRILHPTYWEAAQVPLTNRGQWVTATSYFYGDITYDSTGNLWAMAVEAFTSGADIDTDILNGHLVPFVDVRQAVIDTAASEAAALLSENAAALSESNAAASQVAAAGSASAASTSAGNAAISETNAAASALSASNVVSAGVSGAIRTDVVQSFNNTQQEQSLANQGWSSVLRAAAVRGAATLGDFRSAIGIDVILHTALASTTLAAFRTAIGLGYANAAERAAFQTSIGNVAARKNLIVNPRMQVSQENGNSAAGTNSYYAADQWFTAFITSAGVISTQRVQSVTPRGSKDRLRVSVTTADLSLAAGEVLVIGQSIEGNRVAHLKYGTAGAVQTILRFGFKGPAGTYAVSIENSATNRSYVALFVIAGGQANTDTEQTLVIPGDTSGTWLTDTGVGLTLRIALATGSTFQAPAAGVWNAARYFGTSGVSNGLGANTNVFELFDVGLYADPDGLGIAPPWVPNSFDFDLFECKRYYQFTDVTFGDVTASVGARYISAVFVPEMRVGPTTGNFLALETASNVSSTSLAVVSVREGRVGIIPAASGAVFMHQRFSCNARM